MFFAGSGFSSLMATHPPLDKRIKAIDPHWNGEMLQGMADTVRAEDFSGAVGFTGSLEGTVAQANVDSLGESGRLDINLGAAIREDLREGKVTAYSKQEAKALLLGLLVSADHDRREMAKRILEKNSLDSETVTHVIAWSVDLEGYGSSKKLALVDLSLSWLRKMSSQEALEFVKISNALIEADVEVNLFEFMLQKVIERHVLIGLGLKPVPVMRHRKIENLERGLADLLGMFAMLAGGGSAMDNAAVEYLGYTGRELPRTAADLAQVSAALVDMDAATPLVKQQILRLCNLVVMDDGYVASEEMELLRATAEAIGAPIPPLVRKAA